MVDDVSADVRDIEYLLAEDSGEADGGVVDDEEVAMVFASMDMHPMDMDGLPAAEPSSLPSTSAPSQQQSTVASAANATLVAAATAPIKRPPPPVLWRPPAAPVSPALPPLPAEFNLWTPRDDLLLKDAMEAGAAMEALAKGAMRFTRRFTLEELRRRWNALLYDPRVARSAAERMLALPIDATQPDDDFGLSTSGRETETLQDSYRERRRQRRSSSGARATNADGKAVQDGGKRVRDNAERSDESEIEYSCSDVEEMILDMDLAQAGAEAHDLAARSQSRRLQHRRSIVRLEQAAAACAARAASREGAMAVLSGRVWQFLIRNPRVTLGRATDSGSVVDLDLSLEGNASRVSRVQAVISLHRNAKFYLRNVGRRPLSLNGRPVEPGHRARLGHAYLLEVGVLRFVFCINKRLVEQAVEQLPTPTAS